MNILFLVYLIVEAIFGIGFLFFPDLLMGPMGVTLDATSASFARMLGSLMISIVVLVFFARRSTNPEFRKGLIYCVLVYLFISTIVLVIDQLNGLLNAMGWSIVILHLVFLIWFGYYALTYKPSIPE
jgi:hypothetical protein